MASLRRLERERELVIATADIEPISIARRRSGVVAESVQGGLQERVATLEQELAIKVGTALVGEGRGEPRRRALLTSCRWLR
jgi:hypothetical protein